VNDKEKTTVQLQPTKIAVLRTIPRSALLDRDQHEKGDRKSGEIDSDPVAIEKRTRSCAEAVVWIGSCDHGVRQSLHRRGTGPQTPQAVSKSPSESCSRAAQTAGEEENGEKRL
jgi:hypothetical protein